MLGTVGYIIVSSEKLRKSGRNRLAMDNLFIPNEAPILEFINIDK